MKGEAGRRTDLVTHRIGECPACRGYLWAEVAIVSRVSEPTLTVEGKASVYASAKAVAMTVSHACDSREDDPA